MWICIGHATVCWAWTCAELRWAKSKTQTNLRQRFSPFIPFINPLLHRYVMHAQILIIVFVVFFACCMRECCRTHSLTQTTLASSFFCIYAISNTHKKYKWLFSFFVCAFYLVCLLVSLVCSCVLVSLTILPCLYEFLCFRHKPILIKGLDTFL